MCLQNEHKSIIMVPLERGDLHVCSVIQSLNQRRVTLSQLISRLLRFIGDKLELTRGKWSELHYLRICKRTVHTVNRTFVYEG